MRRALMAAGLAAATLLAGGMAAGCASSGSSSSGAGSGGSAPVTLRLGFLVNITHASALVGIKEGLFTKDLGHGVTLKLTPFSTGTEESTALLAGQLDAAYVGPNPAIKAWQTSDGRLIKVISGAASAGAALVVKPSITSASQLKGQSLATPSLGNTQDVALRYWLKQQGLTTSATGGGDVSVKPTTPNSAAVLEFKSGQIAGASEPSPYDVQMVQDGGKVLLSEPGVTTVLMVTQSFLSAHPDIVADLLKANIQAIDYIKADPSAAAAAANDQLAAYTGKPLKATVLGPAFQEITFTVDPDAASLTEDARQAVSVGVLKPVDLTGIFDLGPLNALLTAADQPSVSG